MKAFRFYFLAALLMCMPFSPAFAQIVIYQAGQLDQLLAPIALYPDPLIGQVLVAAAYPQQVLDAEEWLTDQSHVGWSNDQLLADLQQAPWDASVKFLTAFPQVLHVMSQNIAWTQNVGNAYAMQQDNVRNVIQDLRRDAQEAGNLYSTPLETVYDQGSDILIQPRDPNKVAVPVYDPTTVYGAWLYPEYPPFFFSHTQVAATTTYVPVVAIATVQPFFLVHPWDWHRQNIEDQEGAFSHDQERRVITHTSQPSTDGRPVNGQPSIVQQTHAPAPSTQQNNAPQQQEIEKRTLQPTNGVRPLGGIEPGSIQQPHSAPMIGTAPLGPGTKPDTNQDTQGH